MGVNGIYGLSGSGLDIESLVKMGMMSKQNQYDKMVQKQTKQTWLKEAYNEVYSDVKTFQADMSQFKMQSNMNAMKATSADSSVATVTANGAAASMTHKIAVTSTASNAYVMTGDGEKITRASGASTATSTQLTDIIYGDRYTGTTTNDDGSYTYTIDGVEHSGSDVAISLQVQDSTETDADGNPTTYTISYTYDQLFQDKKTLSDFASAFSSSGANIQGNYDSTNDSFSLYNKTGGASNIIGLSGDNDDTTTLLNNLNLAAYNSDTNSLSSTISFTKGSTTQAAAGTAASAIIDGKTYTSDSNTLTVAGVTYTLNGVSATNDDGSYKTTTVNVSQDTDTIIDNVKKFVEIYNTLIDSLNDKLSEESYSDYDPLTSSQEDEMTEEQIEKWNEKAKSGLLYNDSNIRSIVSDMREAIYTKVDAVDSAYNSLSAIGITTSTTGGHLTLDEEKLEEALAADPDCVYQLFASDQDSSYISGSTNKNYANMTSYNVKNDYLNTGIANRLYNLMGDSMDVLEDYAGTDSSTDDDSYLGNLLTNLQTKMDNFKTLMEAYQDKLYEKYDAMEVALSQLGTQLSYITGSSS